MGRKEQMREKAQKHTEILSRKYSEEIKKCIEETHLYDTSFIRTEETGKEAAFLLEQSYTQDSVIRNSEMEKMAGSAKKKMKRRLKIG